jgi:AraC family transcriptional regulator
VTSRLGATPRVAAHRPSVAQYPAGATFGPRRLTDFEFVWMLRGTATWQADDGRSAALRPGVLLLAAPGTRDRYAWDPTATCRHAYVHFTVESDGDPAGWPVCRRAEPDGPLPGLLAYLVWLGSRAPAGWQHRVDDVVSLLLATYFDGPLPEPDAPLPPVLGAVVDHVRAVWEDGRLRQVSLGELAGAASVSSGYLARAFRRQYGVGPVTAFERLRLARAASMLLRSNFPIAVIADGCGFADQYHFSRRFSLVYGTPPSRYRRLGSGADADSALADARLLRLADQVWPR